MIVFDLKCGARNHVFEAWFGSGEDYEDQLGRGLVSCPLCGSLDIAKAAMAPRVPAKANGEPSAGQVKAALAAMAGAQKKLLEGSDYVGDGFADEARAIHLGEADARSIHGRATREQTEGLRDEGIQIAPLPFPVIEPGQEN